MESILIIAPHPDDETLGCGGTILKYINQGSKVYWLICTEFYRNGKTPENIKLRQQEIEEVDALYGFTKRFELGYDAAGITYNDIGPLVGKISSIVKEIRPDTLFLPNRSDVHTDHQIIFKAAFSCTKNFNFPYIKQVLMYETISETEFAPALPENAFMPNVYIDISPYADKKLEIMQVYRSEVMEEPLPRSLAAIKALGAYRGSSIGVHHAEAFMLLKQIIN
jgi:LmbE family N-acetylglucosaminyl deacetylase